MMHYVVYPVALSASRSASLILLLQETSKSAQTQIQDRRFRTFLDSNRMLSGKSATPQSSRNAATQHWGTVFKFSPFSTKPKQLLAFF